MLFNLQKSQQNLYVPSGFLTITTGELQGSIISSLIIFSTSSLMSLFNEKGTGYCLDLKGCVDVSMISCFSILIVPGTLVKTSENSVNNFAISS